MSTYVMSDIHGCRVELDAMLEQICFSEYDELWVVGDICDRGNDNIGVLRTLMAHPNMHLVFGNHDQWFLRYAQTLIDAKKNPSSVNMTDDLLTWLHFNGGFATANEFMDLDFPECYDMKCYLENPDYYQEIEVGGRQFLLIHAGLGSYASRSVRLSTVPINELIWSHIGIDDNPFDDRTMIVGHTPTFLYGDDYDGKVIHGRRADIMHIDCGCVYGRSLGCVRLNDMKEFYVPSSYPYVNARPVMAEE